MRPSCIVANLTPPTNAGRIQTNVGVIQRRRMPRSVSISNTTSRFLSVWFPALTLGHLRDHCPRESPLEVLAGPRECGIHHNLVQLPRSVAIAGPLIVSRRDPVAGGVVRHPITSPESTTPDTTNVADGFLKFERRLPRSDHLGGEFHETFVIWRPSQQHIPARTAGASPPNADWHTEKAWARSDRTVAHCAPGLAPHVAWLAYLVRRCRITCRWTPHASLLDGPDGHGCGTKRRSRRSHRCLLDVR